MGNLSVIADRVIQVIKTATAAALYAEAELTMTESKKIVNVDTGTLRGTGHVEQPKIEGNRVTVTLGYGGPAAPYAKAVHEGYGPHEIRVKNARTLAVPVKKWRGVLNPDGLPRLSKDGNYVILGKKVRHPGYKGNPYLREPVERNLGKIKDAVVNRISQALKGLE